MFIHIHVVYIWDILMRGVRNVWCGKPCVSFNKRLPGGRHDYYHTSKKKEEKSQLKKKSKKSLYILDGAVITKCKYTFWIYFFLFSSDMQHACEKKGTHAHKHKISQLKPDVDGTAQRDACLPCVLVVVTSFDQIIIYRRRPFVDIYSIESLCKILAAPALFIYT